MADFDPGSTQSVYQPVTLRKRGILDTGDSLVTIDSEIAEAVQSTIPVDPAVEATYSIQVRINFRDKA